MKGMVNIVFSVAYGYHHRFAMAELSLLSLKKSLAYNMTTEPVSLEIGSTGPNRI